MRGFCVIALIAASGLITGCGQKGPLMLPDAHTASPVVVESPAASAASAAGPANPAGAAASASPPR